MKQEMLNHIISVANKNDTPFVKCNGILYEVLDNRYLENRRYPIGPQPMYSVEEVDFIEADFVEEKN